MNDSVTHELSSICYPVFSTMSVFSLDVCTGNLTFKDDGVTPVSCDLLVKACVGESGIKECTTLIGR
tara:strand:- start:2572 stop:2772 length:201 start_codon:yes stop_codon:yes gene_type:complete